MKVFMRRARPDSGRVALLALGLSLLQPRGGRAEDSVSYKYQHYQEDDNRILVKAHYLFGHFEIGSDFTVQAEGLIDSISGATPTGQPPPPGSDQVPLSELTEEHKAIILDGSYQFGEQLVTLQYAYSTESDYDSNGVSVSLSKAFNQKNTTLLAGYAYTDDSILALYLEGWQKKYSNDFLIGVNQLIDPKTILTVNFSYGDIDGYQNDPYKLVEKNVEILPGLALPLTFPENRPTHRTKFVGYASLNRHFENLNASVEGSYRYFNDSFGVTSSTIQVEWFQKLGSRFVLRPMIRWYKQTAADFYVVSLDGTDIDPGEIPTGLAPYYSADYRISAMETLTYGLKGILQINDWLGVDANIERYQMKGTDGVTSPSAYPDATVITVGINATF